MKKISWWWGLFTVLIAAPALALNVTAPITGAPTLWGGTPPNFPASGITGKGVIVGIVDSGIDFTHLDFKYPGTNNTRVLWMWDQNGSNEPHPSFNYGTEYTQAGIDSGKIAFTGSTPRGTQIASAAAGNGQGTGNGKPPYTYVGIAPEADLIVVNVPTFPDGSMPDRQVIDGVNYVFQKATALGEPAVVLLAVGKMTGPHDGHDPLDEAVSALTGPGKIVVAAAGDLGGTATHAVARTSSLNQIVNLTYTVPVHNPGQEGLKIEGWYNAAASYTVSVISPTGEIAGPVANPGTTTLPFTGCTISVGNGTIHSDNGSSRIDVSITATTGGTIASGTWTIQLESEATGASRADFWITFFTGFVPVFAQGMTDSCLVTSPATADSVIAVGAYSVHPTWTALNGSVFGYNGAVFNTIAPFSGPGPRRDEALCPQITAQDFGLAVARQNGFFPLSAFMMPDSVHMMTKGTADAAGVAAGAIALILQNAPFYGRAQVLDYLAQYAVSDGFTGTVPNPRWGYGKLHLAPAGASVRVAPQRITLRLRSESPAAGPKQFDAVGPGRFEIFDVTGRRVAFRALPSGAQVVRWEGGRPGLYWARLRTAAGAAMVRFVELQ